MGDRPVRDWPALLGAGHPLAKPGALVYSEEYADDDCEAWLSLDVDEDGEPIVLMPPTDDGEWIARYRDWSTTEHPTALQALADLSKQLEAEARAIRDRAALCGGEP